jgi:NTP pyrophosphatase (non-canonical NTP hydrolase)
MDDIKNMQDQIRVFTEERDWEKFHSPKNLSMALSVEVSELMEIFQWLTESETRTLSEEQRAQVEEELGDIFIYLLRISDVTGINLRDSVSKKIKINAMKYPKQISFGKSTKYDKL